MIKKGLGKGLSALIPDENENEAQEAHKILLKLISTNPYQPRKTFNKESMEELVKSIEEHGVIQPILVRKSGKNYELVAGERRFRAAQQAGLKQIPAVVLDLEDDEMLEYAIIENLQREDLNPLEEAEAYKQLMDEFSFTQEKLAKRIGKSRPVIANTLRLLSLEPEVKQYLREGSLSAGHARALASIEEKKIQRKAAGRILQEKMTVRETEKFISDINKNPEEIGAEKEEGIKKKQIAVDPQIIDIEERLCRQLGTRVKIKDKKQKGRIEIEYYSHEELERILERLF
ncbi:ParB/RepB/Spo0J family partition protein [Candidatus Contubernalis alkaliaceticus]|uniref:ParB/RepB/Spo0J family partition protein n=1 Tax=Candidatus Contubernalis alkaliaceticus TaxID=338645 RepID=UPI001F4C1598|nr:ParB/RepB/Spo0J family partition protein [Candidatus Contubernalis alkalaceticus]UNC93724.1 ParB/RepB/Spo0J family partition protein [Candidatus Contubernalis alkalaceticus]